MGLNILRNRPAVYIVLLYLKLLPMGISGEVTSSSQFRTAMTRLLTHIRQLPVAREKVPPLVISSSGVPTINVDSVHIPGSVLEVNDVQQTVKTTAYILLSWRDEALAWNASDFSGIQVVEVGIDDIWTPAVFPLNSMTPDENVLAMENQVLALTCDGVVTARAVFKTDTICDMDLTHYPFDEQECPLIFSSLSKYGNWTVTNFHDGRAIAQSLGISAEWTIERSHSYIQIIESLDETLLITSILMKRKTTFYAVCLVMPMVLTSYMNTLVFLLPLQSGEKVSFIVTIFVSTFVFVSYFTTMMPRGLNNVPYILQLLTGVIVESLIILFLTIIVLIRHHRDTKATADLLCACARRSRVHDIKTTSSTNLQQQGEKIDTKTESSVVAEDEMSRPTAKELDRLFFVLTFVGNTAFLAVLLAYAVSHWEKM